MTHTPINDNATRNSTAHTRQLLRWVFPCSAVSLVATTLSCASLCTCALLCFRVMVLSVCAFVVSVLTVAVVAPRVLSLRVVAVVCASAALTGGSPVAVSAGCVVSKIKRRRLCSTLASLSWLYVCFKAACNRLSTCALIALCVAVVVSPTLSAADCVARLYCVLAVVVVSLIT